MLLLGFMLLLGYNATIQQYAVAGLCCCWAIMLQLQYAVAGQNDTIQQYAVVGLYAVAEQNNIFYDS